MYYLYATGLLDKDDARELIEDDKEATYRAAELGGVYPIVLVYTAFERRGVFRRIAVGKALLKVINGNMEGAL